MYKFLDKRAIKVMRINSILTGIGFTILCVISYLVFYPTSIKYVNVIFVSLIIFILINVLLNIFIYPIIRYKRYKYLVSDKEIIVQKGLFVIKKTIIQIKRVQKVEISTGPIDRKFSLSNVNFYTSAGVLEIKFLSNGEAKKICDKVNELLKKSLVIKNGN